MTNKETTAKNPSSPADKSSSAKASADKDIEANKTLAALSYAWILCLVPLLGRRDSKFAQFHAKQGLVLFIIEIIAGLIFLGPAVWTAIDACDCRSRGNGNHKSAKRRMVENTLYL